MSRFPFDDLPDNERDLDAIMRRAAAQKPRLKRFYKEASAVADGHCFALQLDGRAARTPARHALLLPRHAIADKVVAEWNGQGEHIDPNTMPFTRIANSAIDGVAGQSGGVIDDLVRYAGSDLVFYRAEGPERLVAEQERAWNPVLTWARERLGASFVFSTGITHRTQPPEAISAIRSVVQDIPAPFALAALHVMTTLSGSVLIPLMHVYGGMDGEAAWLAAHVDENYQENIWGIDDDAARRRDARQRDFLAASEIFLAI